MTKFINRKIELDSLNKKWQENKSHLIIVYGKRRVGKTELIKQFIKNKPSVYFLADKTTSAEQLKELGWLMGSHFHDSILKQQGFPSWIEVFKYLKEKTSAPFVFVVDEYPYLVEADKSTSSIFQKGWDEYLKNSKVFMILSGSSVSMMESETLLYKAPLYGRRTGQILLKPLSFYQSREFFPGKKFDEFLAIYTITGGMPAYLLQINSEIELGKNIIEKIFNRTEFLYNEIEFLLKEELRVPRNYLSILKTISWGQAKFSEIVNGTGLEKNVLHKYLAVLERLQLIEKEVSITESNPDKSKKGLYKIADNFVRFWFQFVFPYKSYLEIGNYREVLSGFKPDFLCLESLVYEKICQEILWKNQKEIFRFERVGRWWDKNNEIDVIGLNAQTKEIIFGEAKWSEKQVGTNIYFDLKTKASQVDWNKENREERFILFSKSGFIKDMINLAKAEKVFLVEKDKLD